jgi:hypothetical protein
MFFAPMLVTSSTTFRRKLLDRFCVIDESESSSLDPRRGSAPAERSPGRLPSLAIIMEAQGHYIGVALWRIEWVLVNIKGPYSSRCISQSRPEGETRFMLALHQVSVGKLRL